MRFTDCIIPNVTKQSFCHSANKIATSFSNIMFNFDSLLMIINELNITDEAEESYNRIVCLTGIFYMWNLFSTIINHVVNLQA